MSYYDYDNTKFFHATIIKPSLIFYLLLYTPLLPQSSNWTRQKNIFDMISSQFTRFSNQMRNVRKQVTRALCPTGLSRSNCSSPIPPSASILRQRYDKNKCLSCLVFLSFPIMFSRVYHSFQKFKWIDFFRILFYQIVGLDSKKIWMKIKNHII